MERYRRVEQKAKTLFVGIDLHQVHWHITIRTEEVELFNGSIPASWAALRKLLERHRVATIQAAYEAGYFGFWLHDRLME